MLLVALLWGCGPAPVDTAPDTDVDTDSDTDSDTEAEVFPGVGDPMPGFALEDVNPSSATFGQIIDGADLQGQTYGLIFLDARCTTCVEVADDVYALYGEHPGWWEAEPVFGINGVGGDEHANLVANMVANNSLPYLQDTAEGSIWGALRSLNHDWYVVGPDGVITHRYELYVWPDDTTIWLEHMVGRYGE
jgi:hypothetical protein